MHPFSPTKPGSSSTQQPAKSQPQPHDKYELFKLAACKILNLAKSNNTNGPEWKSAGGELETAVKTIFDAVHGRKQERVKNSIRNLGVAFIEILEGRAFNGESQDTMNFMTSVIKLSTSMNSVMLENASVPFQLVRDAEWRSKPRVIFHVMRHGQAAHNIVKSSTEACKMFDPPLTQEGETQCRQVRAVFRNMDNIQLVLCSPSKRTRQTAEIGFKSLFEKGMKMHLWNKLKEWSTAACNAGLSKEVFEFMGDPKYGLGMLDRDWLEQEESWDTTKSNRSSCSRIKEVRRELLALSKVMIDGGKWNHLSFPKWASQKNIEVLIVSHGNCLSYLLRSENQGFHNADYKSVVFPHENAVANDGSKLKAGELVEISKD